jgi:peptidoglycan/xylan/chitin deacetylase (PgdA/CDA1 family)
MRFVQEAMADQTTLASLRVKPTARVWLGLGLIALSYILGWPAVGLLAFIAYRLAEPWIVAIGGPAVYGFSHLVFIAGAYFAGSHYAPVLLRWTTRQVMERWGRPAADDGESGRRWTFTPAHLWGFAAFSLSLILLPFGGVMAALPLGAFVLACLIFPFVPGRGFFLPLISRGKTDVKAVALTFDDGPDVKVTPPLLELLERHQARAAFFVVGRKAEAHPALIREILSRGHEIGNHSFRHDPLLMLRTSATLAQEIGRTQTVLAPFGVRVLAFRPPVGITNPRLGNILRELGLTCVTFSCRANDFGNRRIDRLSETILHRIHPGAIVLLHDVLPRGNASAEQWLGEVERLILGLKSRGYGVIPLSELIGRPVMAPLAETLGKS